MLSSVKNASKSKYFVCNSVLRFASNIQQNQNKRQFGSVFGSPDWKKSIVEFLTSIQVSLRRIYCQIQPNTNCTY